MNERENERELVRGPWVAIAHVSWGAIFAGAVVSLVVQLTLGMLGLGIGLYAYDPGAGSPGGLGIEALIWWVLSAIIALFFGGWVASRLSGIQTKTAGVLHGFVTWGLATLATVYLMTSTVGALLGGGMSLVQSMGTIAGQTEEMSPQLKQEIEQQLRQYFPEKQPQPYPERQEQQQGGADTAEQVATGAARGALGSFIMLVLGGAAAAFGGAAGRTRPPEIT